MRRILEGGVAANARFPVRTGHLSRHLALLGSVTGKVSRC